MSVPLLEIRPLQSGDLEAAAEIEALAGATRWSREQLAAELKKDIACYFVAALAPRVVGYAGGWMVIPEVQIANVAVHPQFQRRGIGRALLERLLDAAAQRGCMFSTLEVARRNKPAQRLYQRLGFREMGMRAKIYVNPDDDAVLMEKKW